MKNKRPTCSHCLRPKTVCLCDLVEVVNSTIELVIWQHPSEYAHPKGSAQLLHLCLPNSVLFTGETFSPAALGLVPEACCLLYPPVDIDLREPESSVGRPEQAVRQLLVLDGTWRKSRKLLYANPWVQKLPRLSVAGKSQYVIRKAENANQLSTFESVVLALQKLEFADAAAGQSYQALLGVFDAFVARLAHHGRRPEK